MNLTYLDHVPELRRTRPYRKLQPIIQKFVDSGAPAAEINWQSEYPTLIRAGCAFRRAVKNEH